jgi:tetratricopeptide (TPR) repeat protein
MAALLQLGALAVDLDTGEMSTGLQLRPIELALLRYLAERPGEVVPLDRLLVEVWGYNPTVRSRAPYSTVMRLRAAIEPDPQSPRYLLSHRGAGYSLADAERPPPTERCSPSRLPAPATAFVGRQALVAALAEAGDDPLVTLVGPAGIGKTRLALEAARLRAGGVWFCGLEAATTRAEAEPLLAAAISFASGATLAERLGAVAPAVLVLDNLEQLEDRAELVRQCLAVPGIRVIATSRCAVALPEERVIPVPELELDEAAALLRQRVALRRGEGEGMAPEVERALLAHADGVPLALEIIAANVALVGAEAVLAQLEQGGVLRARVRGPERHDSVDAAVTWSLDLLSPDRIRDLCALAVLDGPFGLAAAEAALGRDPFEAVTELCDAALLAPERGRSGGRFRILAPVLAVLWRRPEFERETLLDRLLLWVDQQVTAASQRTVLSPIPPLRLPISVEAHRRLFEAAMRSALPVETRARVVLGLASSAAFLSDGVGAAHWLRRALALGPSPAIEADLQLQLASVEPTDAALDAYPAAIAAARRAGDPSRELLVSLQLALALARDHRRAAEVPALLRELAVIPVPEHRRATALGGAAFVRGVVKQRQNDLEGCEAALREALERLRESDDPIVTLIQTRLAQLTLLRGELDEASELLRAATAARTHDGLHANAWAYAATVWRHLGRREEALAAARRAIDGMRTLAHGYLGVLRLGVWNVLCLGERELGLRWLQERLELPYVGPEMQLARLADRSICAALTRGPEAGLELAETAWRSALEAFPVWASDTGLWLAELRVGVGDLDGARAVLAGPGATRGMSGVDATLLGAELLLRAGERARAAELAAELARGRILPVARARALGVVAIAAELDGDERTASRCLASAGSVCGYDDGWLALHRAVIEQLRAGAGAATLEAVAPEAAPVQLALRWCQAELASGPVWLRPSA